MTPGGPCCDPHPGPGCDDDSCQACVCNQNANCCQGQWDLSCAATAAQQCPSSCTACSQGNCCDTHDQPGCTNDACNACVCGNDAFCCNQFWDGNCVDLATNACPHQCRCGAAESYCPDDCNGDGVVRVNELVTGVNILLGNTPLSACIPVDTNGDGVVEVNELVQGVNAALYGCPS